MAITARAHWMAAAIATLFLLGCGASMQQSGSSQPSSPPPQPPPAPQQSGSVTISPFYAVLGPGQTAQFAASTSGGGAISWLVNGIPGGNASVGTIDANGNYAAPSITASTNAVVKAALSSSPDSSYATAVLALIAPGKVTETANPQVASYSIDLPAPGNVSILFGPDSQHTLTTWSQPAPVTYGGTVQIYVAGMLASTEYHMHAVVKLDNGTSFDDSDHTFTTGAAPVTAPVTVTTTNGQEPQSGIELFDTLLPPEPTGVFATDLQGNVIWTYSYQGSNIDAVQPIKMLSNGDFLVLISFASSTPSTITGNPPSGTIDVIREVDLAGNTIRELSLSSLGQSLAAQGYHFDLKGFHHDVLALPNGHLVLLVNLTEPFTDLPGYPGTTEVLGDLLVDVDQNFKPTWVWNAFDHMDVNRHPMNFPDWTHANALLYSADDHDLLLSFRHQNWIVKIDYQNRQGTGNILWRLGPGGDFTLVGGSDPTDWFYAQHGPNFFTSNTAGVFQIGVMDNGDDRQTPPGVKCGSPGAPSCLYSTALVLQVDETSKTATIVSHYLPNPSIYSFFGGQVDLLADGHVEVDFCAPPHGAIVRELDLSTAVPQIVWEADAPGSDQYRALRLPSLYPGVQW
ncbi:MAG: aryl-sulfate sulfotransferase [Candidatus Acidiferrales bacterium]